MFKVNIISAAQSYHRMYIILLSPSLEGCTKLNFFLYPTKYPFVAFFPKRSTIIRTYDQKRQNKLPVAWRCLYPAMPEIVLGSAQALSPLHIVYWLTHLSCKEFTEYTNLEECITYLCEYINTNGPFDGLLGFSQVTFSPFLIYQYTSTTFYFFR